MRTLRSLFSWPKAVSTFSVQSLPSWEHERCLQSHSGFAPLLLAQPLCAPAGATVTTAGVAGPCDATIPMFQPRHCRFPLPRSWEFLQPPLIVIVMIASTQTNNIWQHPSSLLGPPEQGQAPNNPPVFGVWSGFPCPPADSTETGGRTGHQNANKKSD